MQRGVGRWDGGWRVALRSFAKISAESIVKLFRHGGGQPHPSRDHHVGDAIGRAGEGMIQGAQRQINDPVVGATRYQPIHENRFDMMRVNDLRLLRPEGQMFVGHDGQPFFPYRAEPTA